MKASTLCFISSKGGSGKTVTSSALGTFLASLGHKVLLVDTDASTNGMTLLYLEQLLGRRRQKNTTESVGFGLFEAKEGTTPNLIKISDSLHFIPATFTMNDTESTDHIQFEKALDAILKASGNYNFVLLDAQAGADSYARSAVKLSDQCIIVSEYDPVSVQGIERLKILFSKVMDPASTWILFNKILPEFATAIGDGLSVARYLTPIPWDADVVRAFVRRDLAIDMRSPNPYTLAISQVAYNLFPDETSEGIENWRESTLRSTTEPVMDRIHELQMVELRLEKERERRETFVRLASLSVAGLATAAAVSAAAGLYDFVAPVKLWFENKDTLFTTLAVFTAFVSTVGVILSGYLGRAFGTSKSKSEEMTLELLHREREKLVAILNATEGALKFSKDAGYYERRRRLPSRADAAEENESSK